MEELAPPAPQVLRPILVLQEGLAQLVPQVIRELQGLDERGQRELAEALDLLVYRAAKEIRESLGQLAVGVFRALLGSLEIWVLWVILDQRGQLDGQEILGQRGIRVPLESQEILGAQDLQEILGQRAIRVPLV